MNTHTVVRSYLTPPALVAKDNPLFVLARQSKRPPRIILVLGLSVVVFVGIVLGNIVGEYLGAIVLPRLLPDGPAKVVGTPLWSGVARLLQLMIGFAPTYIILGYWVTRVEQRPFWSLGFPRVYAWQSYLRGLLLGLTLVCGGISAAAAFGFIRFEAGPSTMQGVTALGGVLLVLVGWLFQGAAEEIFCRGWILQSVGARYRPWVAVWVSSLIFTTIHGLNPNQSMIALINGLLFGLFTALYAITEGSLWGVCAYHGIWNWAMGNLLGLDVSGGSVGGGTLINLNATGPDWLTGGAFGPEGGLVVTFIHLVSIGLVVIWRRRRIAAERMRNHL